MYSFTDIPEIHSGNEHFAIENYVLPKEIPIIELKENETKIILPLNQETKIEDYNEIVSAVKKIDIKSLLFLRYIEKIEWSKNSEETKGVFIRSKPKERGANVREVELIDQTNNVAISSEKWLIFSKEISNDTNTGLIEIAFLMNDKNIQPISFSPLIVFFPTEKQTNLGFLVQGPYRTTPSRDNIPANDEWNKKCISITGNLVVESLRWLRDNNMLDIESLQCFPIDKLKFDNTNMFSSLFDIVKTVFINEPLLPRYKGGYISANKSLIARTKELRELFTNEQLSELFKSKYSWLHEEISQDRTPDLRKYFINDLGIKEIQPETIINSTTIDFLKKQTNEWICKFYEFLNKQKTLHEKIKSMPIIRLSNLEHIVPFKDGQPQVFLPGQETEFPTVHKEVCGDEKSESFAFLKAIGLTEPNPVDDVIRNVLPKFDESTVGFTEETYKQAIKRILLAFDTDSTSQKEKLISELKNKKFVAVINAANRERSYAAPDIVYFQTESFKSLFAGIDSIYFVNDEYGLKGEKVRDLFEKCGVYRNLRPIEKRSAFSSTELSEMRRKEGYGDCSSQEIQNDNSLYGLEELLNYLPSLNNDEKIKRSKLVWEELCHLYKRSGESLFWGNLKWSYSWSSHSCSFDTYFIRILNKRNWILNHEGNLDIPGNIFFNSLGWDDNLFLRSKIHFKSDEIQEFEEKTGCKVLSTDEYKRLKQFEKLWQEEQRKHLNEIEKQPIEFATTFSVADAPLKVSDFTGKDQSMPFDDSQVNKSAGQTSNKDSSFDIEKYLNNQSTSDNNDSSDESIVNSEYLKKEGRYGEKYVLKLLNEEYKNNVNVDIIDLNENGGTGVSVDFVVKNKTSGKIVKLVEVKSTTELKGSKQRISGVQWETARKEGDLYWIYCVYNIKNNPEVVRIQNPVQKWKDGLLLADPVDFIVK
ncbi:MAG: DUF3883 domain-containing protein [Bacteroidales bacterium]|nr:DUF3883 domain-containing protein [Bacteroidales bacterium]